MLQAALVYGLIRHYENDHTLDEPTMESIKVPPIITPPPLAGSQLNSTLQAIAVNVGLRGITAKGEAEGLRPNWEEWVLAESRRRFVSPFPPSPLFTKIPRI